MHACMYVYIYTYILSDHSPESLIPQKKWLMKSSFTYHQLNFTDEAVFPGFSAFFGYLHWVAVTIIHGNPL